MKLKKHKPLTDKQIAKICEELKEGLDYLEEYDRLGRYPDEKPKKPAKAGKDEKNKP